jgi:hypothetical protein
VFCDRLFIPLRVLGFLKNENETALPLTGS